MAWDEAKKALAVELYEKAEPTPENSMEIVKEVAEELEETVNGVRMILSKAGVYVKVEGKKTTPTKTTEGKTPRVSKADAIEGLTTMIQSTGVEPDGELLSKLTGKQAAYFTDLLKKFV